MTALYVRVLSGEARCFLVTVVRYPDDSRPTDSGLPFPGISIPMVHSQLSPLPFPRSAIINISLILSLTITDPTQPADDSELTEQTFTGLHCYNCRIRPHLNMESNFIFFDECRGELSLVIAAIFHITYLLYRRNVTNGGHKLPPALPSLPFVGSLPFLSNKGALTVFFLGQTTKLGKVFSFRAGTE